MADYGISGPREHPVAIDGFRLGDIRRDFRAEIRRSDAAFPKNPRV